MVKCSMVQLKKRDVNILVCGLTFILIKAHSRQTKPWISPISQYSGNDRSFWGSTILSMSSFPRRKKKYIYYFCWWNYHWNESDSIVGQKSRGHQMPGSSLIQTSWTHKAENAPLMPGWRGGGGIAGVYRCINCDNKEVNSASKSHLLVFTAPVKIKPKRTSIFTAHL